MRTIIISFLLQLLIATAFCQSDPALVFIKHDTVYLRSSESNWVIKSLLKNDPALTGQIGKSVSQILIESIAKGKLKATDVETNKPIAAKLILTRKTAVDTVAEYDPEGNLIRYRVIQAEIDFNKISELRIHQDMYLNVSSGKIISVIKSLDLMLEIYSPEGTKLGYQNFCRIYY